jgi:hypothetical protein
MPGGRWQPFSCAFRSTDFESYIEIFQTGGARPATEIVTRLNGVLPRIATATTSKMAYFAGLVADEGACLIYDSMVRRAIRARSDGEFTALKAIITRRKADLLPSEQAETYGLYLAATHAMAARLNVQGDQIELFLFLGRENAAALSPHSVLPG